jgi:glyoxylase-like metal-dependent hydrolase (beta-lactamase superfamily II)
LSPREITEGLWRWTTPHPDWLPGVLDSLEDWPREVGCVLFEGPDVSLFIDPLVPADAAEFWRWADARCAGRPVAVLTTLEWHARSRDAVLERYGGVAYAAGKSRDIEVLPAGVECFTVEPLGETVVWLSGPRTVVAGDVIVGSGTGSLRLCPESWLANSPHETTLAEIAELLRPLLALPIERVLVTHGDPAYANGHAALAAALEPVAVGSR